MTMTWNPEFAERAPMFELLRAAAHELRTPYWPGCDELNRIVRSQRNPILTAGGQPLCFVEQQLKQQTFEDKYEPRIFLRGEVQIRSCNWHDLLNALVWLTFPFAKAALNRRHYEELVRQRASGAPNRGPAQDALTLFDEGGVIVAVADPALGELLRDFKWTELFWRRRADVARSMRFYLFGHALYEKALAPFVGVTGRGVIFEVADGFLAMPLAQQLAELDARLAGYIDDPARFSAPRELAPVPVLGVPGWCADNEREDFYDNPRYFRPPPPR